MFNRFLAALVILSLLHACGATVGSRYITSQLIVADEGGTVRIPAGALRDTGEVTLTIGPGVLAEDTVITVEPGLPQLIEETERLSHSLEFGPPGLVLGEPAELEVRLAPGMTLADDDVELVTVTEGEAAAILAPSAFDAAKGVLVFRIPRLGTVQARRLPRLCAPSRPCAGDAVCQNGVCRARASDGGVATRCAVDGGECGSAQICVDGACVMRCPSSGCPGDGGTPGGDGGTCPRHGASCFTGLLGVCSGGVVVCLGGGPTCVQTVNPRLETCNGLDDNCNGFVDETCSGGDGGLAPADGGTCRGGQPCRTELPGVCGAGREVCIGSHVSCQPQALPSPERCNGIDDDCDWLIDEGCTSLDGGAGPFDGGAGPSDGGAGPSDGGARPSDGGARPSDGGAGPSDGGGCPQGQACSTGLAGRCSVGVVVCGASVTCVPVTFGFPESCNGLDDDCDGVTDEFCPGLDGG